MKTERMGVMADNRSGKSQGGFTDKLRRGVETLRGDMMQEFTAPTEYTIRLQKRAAAWDKARQQKGRKNGRS